MKKIIKWLRNIFNHKVLFCDLDGTLIVTKSGKTFPEDEADWKFKDGILSAIYKYNPKYVFIVTNQGGIEKGFVNKEKFRWKLTSIAMNIMSNRNSNIFVDWSFCDTNDPENKRRKPNPGMIFDFLDVYDIRKADCLMIGDASGKDGQFSNSDLLCAKNAGIKYCDVDDFIRAADPCFDCSMRDDCYYNYECEVNVPFYKSRLKRVIVENL